MLWCILISLVLLCWVRADDDEHSDDYFHFVTRPDIGAPKWNITIYDEGRLQQGKYYWFISPYDNLHQEIWPHWNGPLMYDTSGELIWSGAPFHNYTNTFDFRVTQVDGQPMLSYINIGNDNGRSGTILDSSYEVHTTVNMQGEMNLANMHEFNVIDDGKRALMVGGTEVKSSMIDAPTWNGSCQVKWEGFQEVDVDTGNLMFEFNSQGHMRPLEHTYINASPEKWKKRCSSLWDAFHINSVDKFDNGDYLFSARYTDTIYKVSHIDHSIVWRLGSIWSDFVFVDPKANFSRQHHARIQSQNGSHTVISLFDNAAGPGFHKHKVPTSRGLLLALRTDVIPMTAVIVEQFDKPPDEHVKKYVHSRGSLSFLPNGNAFLGWVNQCYLTEHSPDGTVLMKAMIREKKANSYRTYKLPWIGRPSRPPDVVATAAKDDSTVVHVSWNGATEVVSWALLRTNKLGDISVLVASSPRQGFETRLVVTGYIEYVIAVALDRDGEELGRSKVITVDISKELEGSSLAVSEQQWTASHSSASWEAPATRPRTTQWELFQRFLIGLLSSVILCGLVLWLRSKMTSKRKEPWLAARLPAYDAEQHMNKRKIDELIDSLQSRVARLFMNSWLVERLPTYNNSQSINQKDEIGQQKWMLEEEDDDEIEGNEVEAGRRNDEEMYKEEEKETASMLPR